MLARVKESGPGYPVTVAGLDFVKHEWRWFPDERQAEFDNHPFLTIDVDTPVGVEEMPEGEVDTVVEEPAEVAEPEMVDEPTVIEEEPPSVIDATASAFALAEAHGLDLSGVAGSGSGGRITKADVEAVI